MRDACLFSPFFGRNGRVLGIVRCRNKSSHGFAVEFNEDDLAILSSICEASAPLLDVIIAEEGRKRAYIAFHHELSQPLVSIRGALQFARDKARLETRAIRGALTD